VTKEAAWHVGDVGDPPAEKAVSFFRHHFIQWEGQFLGSVVSTLYSSLYDIEYSSPLD
jgi:hypothetical protein